VRVAVGLGNPGRRYTNTRHNLGFRVVDVVATQRDGTWSESTTYCFCFVNYGRDQLLLVKPSTFMNTSGEAVVDVVERFFPDINDLMVVVDDVHLALGQNRLRRKGSDGGHNGLTSIQVSLNSSKFPRLRMGIGTPPEGVDLIDHVLGDFDNEEQKVVEAQIGRAVESLECWVDGGLEVAMNRFNSED